MKWIFLRRKNIYCNKMFGRPLKDLFEKETKKKLALDPKVQETFLKNLGDQTTKLIQYISTTCADLFRSRNQQTIQERDVWGSLFALFELDSKTKEVQQGRYTSPFLKQASSFMKKTLEKYHNTPAEKGRRISNTKKTGVPLSTASVKSLMKEVVPEGTRISEDAVVLLTAFTYFLLEKYMAQLLKVFREEYPDPTDKQKKDFFGHHQQQCSFLVRKLPDYEKSFCIFSNML